MFLVLTVFGFTEITLDAVIDVYINYDENSTQHIVIQNSRMPRALVATAVGASLAIAGALMQALTKNPLASPSIFGINAGAAFFVVVSILYFSLSSLSQFIWIAFSGAAASSIIVYFLGSLGRDGLKPIKIVLAGAAITALFTSFTQGLLVLNERSLQEVLFWLAGSVSGRTMEMLILVLPYLVIGWIAALAIARSVNLLIMGEDVAKGLGQRTGIVKIIIAIIVIILAGGSVAVAGTIGFIGIIIPHVARFFVGIDYRWLLPYCGLLGAILLLVADVIARFILMPQEVPVGVMTALVGTPFFIYIARRGFNKA